MKKNSKREVGSNPQGLDLHNILFREIPAESCPRKPACLEKNKNNRIGLGLEMKNKIKTNLRILNRKLEKLKIELKERKFLWEIPASSYLVQPWVQSSAFR